MARYSKRSLEALKGVHPDLQKVMHEAIKETPIDFTIIEGVRTAEQQAHYYASGRTRKGPIITYADGKKNKSNHQKKADGYGHAVDIYSYYNGKLHVSDDKSLKIIADHIKKVAKNLGVKIVWGGDWKRPYDPPHFQLG